MERQVGLKVGDANGPRRVVRYSILLQFLIYFIGLLRGGFQGEGVP